MSDKKGKKGKDKVKTGKRKENQKHREQLPEQGCELTVRELLSSLEYVYRTCRMDDVRGNLHYIREIRELVEGISANTEFDRASVATIRTKLAMLESQLTKATEPLFGKDTDYAIKDKLELLHGFEHTALRILRDAGLFRGVDIIAEPADAGKAVEEEGPS